MLNFPNTNLYVGDIRDNENVNNSGWAVVHATQTIHYQYFSWNRTTAKPDKNHPNYIIYTKENHLSLNWVDGASYLYKLSGAETFVKTLNFIDKWIMERKVLVHCDQGYSRSPSLCLLYLSKRMGMITNESYSKAKIEFMKLYQDYNPGGIGNYIDENWTIIK